MGKTGIGLVIKQIIKEKRLSVTEISNQSGIHRQTIYNTFSRLSMSLDEIDHWASLLNVSREYIISRTEGTESNKSADNGKFGDEVLMRLLEEMKGLKEQLQVKDKQIGQLLDLLGKLKGICLRPFGQPSSFFFAVS